MRPSKGHLPVETSPRQATASSSDHLPETTRYQPTQGAKTDWLYEGPRTRFSHRQTVPSTLKKYSLLTDGRFATKERQYMRTNHGTHIAHDFE